jgi:hypothetical protein
MGHRSQRHRRIHLAPSTSDCVVTERHTSVRWSNEPLVRSVSRVDVGATLSAITFPDEIWAWLDLLGYVIRVTDDEASRQDATFSADTQYKKFLVAGVHQQISSLKAIYLLLRAEFSHQAAGQVRLYCEGLISLRFVSQSPEERAQLFWDYSYIEAYEAMNVLLEWERATAGATRVAALEAKIKELARDYARLRPRYQVTNRNGKVRNYVNWCNRSIAAQAKDCGASYERLYRLVYAQMSAYVHGSPWSLRHVAAYSQKAYDAEVVLWDVTAIVTATIAVWLEFAGFVAETLGWKLNEHSPEIVAKAKLLAEREAGPRRRSGT